MPGYVKIIPNNPHFDLAQSSLDWIQGRVDAWFKRKGLAPSRVWYPDEQTQGLDKRFPKELDTVEVVLTGGYLQRLLEFNLWPFKSQRLWVLSSRVREILTQRLGLPEDSVGLIPRREVFENRTGVELGEFPQKLPLRWIYAGRLSPGKNILGLLETVSVLQNQWRLPIALELYGDFDDLMDPSWGRYQAESHETQVRKLLKRLPWTVVPRIFAKVSESQWLNALTATQATNQGKVDTCLVSFSTHIAEDFGVSAQLALERGIPCLLSDWGGPGELQLKAIRYLSYSMIPQTYEPEPLRSFKAMRLAKHLQSEGPLRSDSQARQMQTPRYYERGEYAMELYKVLKGLLPEVMSVVRGNSDTFADTKKGRNFYLAARDLMAGSPPIKDVYLINDFHESNSNSEVARQRLKKLLLVTDAIEPIEFISIRDLCLPFNLERSHGFREIYSLYPLSQTRALSELLGNALSREIKEADFEA